MKQREAVSAASVAKTLRAEIIAGDYDETGKVPSRTGLSGRFGISPENASVVLRMLESEGWIKLEQGRGSFLRPRHEYSVTITLPASGAVSPSPDGPEGLETAVRKASEEEPAARWPGPANRARGRDGLASVDLAIEAASPPYAALIAERVLIAAELHGWSWDGWDLARATYTAKPGD